MKAINLKDGTILSEENNVILLNPQTLKEGEHAIRNLKEILVKCDCDVYTDEDEKKQLLPSRRNESHCDVLLE